MEVIVILILASLSLAGLFLAIFVWATKSGQFEDTTTPALRILADDAPSPVRAASAVTTASHTTRTQTHP